MKKYLNFIKNPSKKDIIKKISKKLYHGRGTRIGDEEERNWARRRGGKKSEELVMASGWGAQG